jgi:hypothetical protein
VCALSSSIRLASALAAILFLAASADAQIDTAILRPVGYHPSGIAYYNTPYFANALYAGGEWLAFTGSEFGTPVDFNTAQFEHGYPKFLQPGQKLRAPVFGLHAHSDALTKGTIVVTWKGNADVRLVGGTFVSTGSNGGATGDIVDGRRIYDTTGAGQSTQSLEVHSIVTPLTELRVWLPELEGQLFHPLLLERIADADWGFIRFMDWGATNASPQQDWSDRRVPADVFMNGVINGRAPAAGAQGGRETGVAYEHMIALSNATGRNLWINVPHLATDAYIEKLAKLIRFGSDGVNPYDAPQASPLFPPLDAGLKVYVEFSNEIWSGGFSFPQGNWAEDEAAERGLTRPQFTARRFCDTWRIFQQVFGGTSRLVRVAAIFTALNAYSEPFLHELGAYGTTLTPPVRPDVMAVTTYFGNGIQDFVHQQGFTAGNASHLTLAFDEWKRRILAGDAAQGGGPDATGIGGGFSSSLRTLPDQTLGYSLPIIAYEGGPSLYTDTIDDEDVTAFVIAMNRDPRIADVYRIHLDIAKSKGLWTHTPYTDTSPWSRFGQWGHLETLDQPPASAPKYALMLEHFTRYSTLRHIDAPLGSAPAFATAAVLPSGIAGQPYSADIVTTDGDGVRTITVVGAYLEPGLSVAAEPAPGNLRVTGTPTGSRKSYILARVHDADGDSAWRIFTLETFGGAGTLVQSDFRGTSPGLNLPWTKTYVLSPSVTWSGWSAGTGVVPQAGDNALVFSVSGSSSGDEYLTATVTPVGGPLDLRGAEVRFATRRLSYHASLTYTLDGFYTSTAVSKDDFDEHEHVVTLPSTSAFAAVTSPLVLRIDALGSEFDGHSTSLTAFKLTSAVSSVTATALSPTTVSVTCTGGAGSYEISRSGTIIGTSTGNSFADTTVAANTAYLYRVRAAGTTAFSAPDLATTVLFSEDAIIRRTHIVELRTAVNAVRTLAGLDAFTFTDAVITAGVTKVRSAHVSELRTALSAALSALSLPVPAFGSGVAAGSAVKAVHVEELLLGVK